MNVVPSMAFIPAPPDVISFSSRGIVVLYHILGRFVRCFFFGIFYMEMSDPKFPRNGKENGELRVANGEISQDILHCGAK